MPTASAKRPPVIRFGSLEAVRTLGRGLAGEVFEACNAAGKRFVVKRLRPQMCGHVDLQRFLRECDLMTRLVHPNIMPVIGIEAKATPPFFVMPFVPGRTVSQLLAERVRLPIALAARVASDVAAGLSHAHALGIVHRDVKPANLYFTSGGRALVFDFGLAKILNGALPLTAIGSVLGTPAYMSPEQIRGGDVDGRADVYSLGIAIHEVITGVNPFAAQDPIETLRRQLEDMPRRLDALLPHKVPTEMGELVHRMIAKTPGHRPTARACGATFEEFARRQERAAAEPTRASTRPRIA